MQKTFNPAIVFARLLELVQHADSDLAWQASLALKFYIERACVTGDASWLANVEAFLKFEDTLADATGAASIKDIQIGKNQLIDLAYEVFRRVEQGGDHAWRYAYILKQAVCVPGLQRAVARYLCENWRKDEAVSLGLLYIIWESENTAEYREALKDMSATATSNQLRDDAAQDLRVLLEIENKRPAK